MGLKGTSKNTKIFIAVLIIATLSIGGYYLYSTQLAPVPTTPAVTSTTIKTISYVDGEIVSDVVEVTIWVPKDADKIEEFEDITYLTTNFEKEESSKEAENIDVDLSAHAYYWIEIDPDGESVFANDFHLKSGNEACTIMLYHQSSKVHFNVMNRDTMAAITVNNLTLAGNYTFVSTIPDRTTTDTHSGSGGWDIEGSDVDDMDATELRELYDERFWRCQAPVYDPANDEAKKYDDTLERITNAFAFELTFNTTVSTTDGNAAQVNCSIVDFYIDYPIEVVTSGDKIYLIFTEVIDFKNQDYSFEVELETGSGIGLDNVKSGRLVVPEDDDDLSTFTEYCAIGAA